MSLKTIYYQGRKAYVLGGFAILTDVAYPRSCRIDTFSSFKREAIKEGADVDKFCYIESMTDSLKYYDSLDKILIGELK